MKSGKISLAMASRTVARIVGLGGRFFENEQGVLHVALDPGCDGVAIGRLVEATRDGQDLYRKAVVQAARRHIAQSKSLPISSDDGSAA